jgi:hypothetical protein
MYSVPVDLSAPNNLAVYIGSTWPPGFPSLYSVTDPMTFTLQYSGGTYAYYEYTVYFATQQIPSGSTIDSVTLYAYVSYASLNDWPIYLKIQWQVGGTLYYLPGPPQVTSAGQTLAASLGNLINVGSRTVFILRAMYTASDSAPTATNQFNVPLSQIWLEVAVPGGIQMIV